MRASGVGLFRIMVPILAVGLAFTLASTVIKETIGTKAFAWTMKFQQGRFTELAEKEAAYLAFYNSQTRRLWMIDRFTPDDPKTLRWLKITQEKEDGKRVKEYLAKKAEWLDGEWWFYNLHIQSYDDQDNPVGDPQPVRPSKHYIIAVPELTETPTTLEREAKHWQLLSTWDMIQFLRQHPNLSEDATAQKRFDIHYRLAMPWACLIVCMFGIPAGARSGRQGVLSAVFMAIGTFFLYYAFSQIGLFLGKTHIIEPWQGAWLSNIIFLAAGILMMRRMR